MKPEKPKHLPEVFYMKSVLKSFAKFTVGTCAGVSFLIKLQAFDLIKIATAVQVFSCEFCEIVKNTFFRKHIRTNESEKQQDQGRKQTNIITSSSYKLGVKKLYCLEPWYEAY